MAFEIHRGDDFRARRSLVAASGTPNQLHASFTGFGTDPNDSRNAMRIQANQFQVLYPGGDFLVWAWDRDGSMFNAQAEWECADFLKIYRAGNARGAYTHLLVDGHSFGGQFLIYLLAWLAANAPDVQIDLARFLDPVPNTTFFGNNWTVAQPQIKAALQFTQRNGIGFMLQAIGPNGTPLPEAWIGSTVFPEEFFPTITHVSLPGDPRVWTPSLAAMQEALK